MIAGPLSIGLQEPLLVREERISNRPDACRLLYVSDIHLRRSRSELLGRQVIDAARACVPDAFLLGGDLVDGPGELRALCELVAALADIAPVFAVGGNHDARVGLDRVRDAVVAAGGEWIHDGTARIVHRSRSIAVSGPAAQCRANADVRVLCAHNPRVWKSACRHGYDLVLAGHLHGCQFVAFEYCDRLYPGALFYPYCFLNRQSETTRLVVSRGVSDLIPIRWRCPREVVLCHV